jgi:hypothetical protein
MYCKTRIRRIKAGKESIKPELMLGDGELVLYDTNIIFFTLSIISRDRY